MARHCAARLTDRKHLPRGAVRGDPEHDPTFPPGGPRQGSTNQGSTNQGSINQGSTNQGSTNQGSTNQGLQTKR
jgi:hypothetical protein